MQYFVSNIIHDFGKSAIQHFKTLFSYFIKSYRFLLISRSVLIALGKLSPRSAEILYILWEDTTLGKKKNLLIGRTEHT